MRNCYLINMAPGGLEYQLAKFNETRADSDQFVCSVFDVFENDEQKIPRRPTVIVFDDLVIAEEFKAWLISKRFSAYTIAFTIDDPILKGASEELKNKLKFDGNNVTMLACTAAAAAIGANVSL